MECAWLLALGLQNYSITGNITMYEKSVLCVQVQINVGFRCYWELSSISHLLGFVFLVDHSNSLGFFIVFVMGCPTESLHWTCVCLDPAFTSTLGPRKSLTVLWVEGAVRPLFQVLIFTFAVFLIYSWCFGFSLSMKHKREKPRKPAACQWLKNNLCWWEFYVGTFLLSSKPRPGW